MQYWHCKTKFVCFSVAFVELSIMCYLVMNNCSLKLLTLCDGCTRLIFKCGSMKERILLTKIYKYECKKWQFGYLVDYMVHRRGIVCRVSAFYPDCLDSFPSRIRHFNFYLGTGKGSTQLHEDNWVATWYEK